MDEAGTDLTMGVAGNNGIGGVQWRDGRHYIVHEDWMPPFVMQGDTCVRYRYIERE